MAKKFKKMTKKEVAREVAALKAEVAGLKTEMALKTEVAGLKTEMARLRAEQRAKLKAEIDNLHKKLQAELGARRAVTSAKREERKARGKVQALEEKAAKAKGEAKAAIEARMTNIRSKPKSTTSLEPSQEKAKPDN